MFICSNLIYSSDKLVLGTQSLRTSRRGHSGLKDQTTKRSILGRKNKRISTWDLRNLYQVENTIEHKKNTDDILG